MKCVVRNIVLDVRQKIFVRCDPESGRSVLPFHLESAPGVDIRESADGSLLSLHVAIAAHAGQMACSNQNETPREDNERGLFHVRLISSVTMRRGVASDSRKFKKGVSPERPSGGLAAFAEATAPKETTAPCDHGAIFIFA